MKTREKYLIFIVLAFSINLLHAKSIPLSEAIKNKMISVSMTSVNRTRDNVSSSYWGPCINFSIKNLTSSPISVQLEPGMFVVADDSTMQRMMIIDNSTLMISANKSKQTKVNAVCSQMFKSAPAQDIAFQSKGSAGGDLLGLAKLIATHKFHSYAAQNAVWALTDNNDIESIYCDNSAEMDTLRKFISNVKHIPMPTNQIVTKVVQTVTKGSFKFSFPNKQGGLYTILLFNSNGDQVQEFSKDYEYPSHDKITVTFRFQTMMDAGTYFVRLIRNGNEIILNNPVIVK